MLTFLATAPSGAGLPVWWWPASATIAIAAGVVLASYVPGPGSGRLLEIGCTPCAAVAGLLAGFALLSALGSVSGTSTAVALALMVAAALQRLNDTGTCPTPAGRGSA